MNESEPERVTHQSLPPGYAPTLGAAPLVYTHDEHLGGTLDRVPATRWARFLARCVDNLAFAAGAFPGGVWLWLDSRGAPSSGRYELPVLLMGIGVLAIVVVQSVLVTRRGQSLGKKVLGIRVVRSDGAPVDFISGVVLREWAPFAIGIIPGLGRFFALADALAIFGRQQRCLHDHIAKTRVVAVMPGDENVDGRASKEAV